MKEKILGLGEIFFEKKLQKVMEFLGFERLNRWGWALSTDFPSFQNLESLANLAKSGSLADDGKTPPAPNAQNLFYNQNPQHHGLL